MKEKLKDLIETATANDEMTQSAAIRDLLTDLRHLSAEMGVDFDSVVDGIIRTCVFCKATIADEEAVEAGWVPYFSFPIVENPKPELPGQYSETGCVCNTCAESNIQIGEYEEDEIIQGKTIPGWILVDNHYERQ